MNASFNDRALPKGSDDILHERLQTHKKIRAKEAAKNDAFYKRMQKKLLDTPKERLRDKVFIKRKAFVSAMLAKAEGAPALKPKKAKKEKKTLTVMTPFNLKTQSRIKPPTDVSAAKEDYEPLCLQVNKNF